MPDPAAQSTPDVPSPTAEAHEHWQPMLALIQSGDAEQLTTFVKLIEPSDVAYTIGRLDEEPRTQLFTMLSDRDAEFAADLMGHFADELSADIIEELEPEQAAAIVDEMDSDDQADVLAEMEPEDARAILDEMDPEEAADAEARLLYAPDSAGGLMITEYFVARAGQTVTDVLNDLRTLAADDDRALEDDHEVRYLYVLDHEERLKGVVKLRHLIVAHPQRVITELMVEELDSVSPDATLDELEDLFDHHSYTAVPVLDAAGVMLGVVQHVAVQEELVERSDEDLAKVGGIVGGEELRSMEWGTRVLGRILFLGPIMLLLIVSATVIALFEGTIERVPILAAFLPVVAGVCGSAGNQAVAVSMREIALGLIKPGDFWYVVRKEAVVAGFNGIVLGVVLMLITWAWKGNPWLGLVIGGAVPMVLLFAACLGGSIPVVLRKVGLDPAMASGPVVTTVVDLASFFTVLILAALLINQLA